MREIVKTEFNIEGNPTRNFLDLVLKNKPHQATLVPDDPKQLTSDSGWDTIKEKSFLTDVTTELQAAGIRVSLFVDPEEKYVEGAKAVGADRIEFYTGKYDENYHGDREKAISPHVVCAKLAKNIGIGVNAGHDLNLENLAFYHQQLPNLLEVSIGHALISDS